MAYSLLAVSQHDSSRINECHPDRLLFSLLVILAIASGRLAFLPKGYKRGRFITSSFFIFITIIVASVFGVFRGLIGLWVRLPSLHP